MNSVSALIILISSIAELSQPIVAFSGPPSKIESPTVPNGESSSLVLPQAEVAAQGDFDAHIVCPGGGIYFYWQAGFVTYLRESGNYNLSRCSFAGGSAGALTATLAAMDVDFYHATDLALKLAKEAKVWDRRTGLQGIWGPMIESWLDELLPDNVHKATAQERLSILVTPLPTFSKECVSKFDTKQDLVECNMASVHLPWFLDGNLWSNFRDKPYIDGSFLATPQDYVCKTNTKDTITMKWNEDPALSTKGGLDFVQALSPDGIYQLLELGQAFARQQDQQGQFHRLPKG